MANEQAAVTKAPEEEKQVDQPATSAEPQLAAEEEAKVEVQTNLNKCWFCSKKVGIVKVPCKCSYVFCPKHRHAEAHNCTFDYFKQN